jgi:hypothetical protein
MSDTPYVRIANPVYDVVFKYMMDDPTVATLFLSYLTGLHIDAIEPLPQEMVIGQKPGETASPAKSPLRLSTYRLDYGVWLREKNGGKGRIIIIEVQTTSAIGESMRYRKYLGYQYLDNRYYYEGFGVAGRVYKLGVPVFPIYILGTGDRMLGDVPVVNVVPVLKDAYTGEVLQAKSDFIDALFHEGIIVNVPALKGRRRDEREQMLSIFDQSYTEQNKRTMLVPMSEIPERFHPLIRRLQTALKVEDVGDMILIDDDFFEDMKEVDRRNREVDRRNREVQHKEQQVQRKEQQVQRKEQEVQHKEQEVQHKEQQVQHKEQEVQRKEEQAIRILLDAGIHPQVVAQKFGISEEDVRRIEGNAPG